MSVLPGDQQLDADLRQRIRHARDQAVRQRLGEDECEGCNGCGGDPDNQTAGCKTCWERHRARRRIANMTQADKQAMWKRYRPKAREPA